MFVHLENGRLSTGQRRLIASLLLLIVGAGVAAATYEWLQALADRQRVRAGCTIIASDVEIQPKRALRRDAPYQFKVRYRFYFRDVNQGIGTSYDGTDSPTDDAAEAFALARQFPVGRETAACFFNSRDPSDVVLAPRALGTQTAILAAVLVVAVGMIRFVCVPLFRRAPRNITPLQKRRNERRAALGVAMVSAAISVWLLILPCVQTFRARTWTPVACEVVSSELISRMNVNGHLDFTSYRPDILFRYRVGGTVYHSNQFNFTDVAMPSSSAKAGLIAAYPVGVQTWCYVNPHNPADAVLTRDIRPGIAIGFLPLAVAGLALWARWRMKRDIRPARELPAGECVQERHEPSYYRQSGRH